MKKPLIGLNLDISAGKFQIGGEYPDSVMAAGGMPLLVPGNSNRRMLDEYVKMADGFVFIGGSDYPSGWYGEKHHPKSVLVHPRRAEVDLYLVRAALRRKIPILGVCGGHQLINIAMGGKIVQHISNAADHQVHEHQTGKRKDLKHMVKISGGRILGALFGKNQIMVNSNHHQAIDPDALGAGLEAVAFADGNIVEAIEAKDLPFVLGVQWHPERMRRRIHASKIFNALVKAARQET